MYPVFRRLDVLFAMQDYSTASLCALYHVVQIGDLANARITMNTRVLWSVQRIKEYLYDISG